MKKKKIIIYIADNSVIYKYKNLNRTIFKSIDNNKIQNIVLFKEEFSSLLKKENINSSLFGDDLYFIVKNESYLEQIKLKDIFREYNFYNINLIDISNLLDKNKTYITLEKNVIFIIYNSQKYKIMFFTKETLHKIICEMIEKDIISHQLYCISKENELIEYLINKKIKILYIYNPFDYLINKLEKKVTNL